MLEYIWKSWSELKDQAKGKQIFLFGRSEDWVHKTIPHLSEFKNIIVVDNLSTGYKRLINKKSVFYKINIM